MAKKVTNEELQKSLDILGFSSEDQERILGRTFNKSEDDELDDEDDKDDFEKGSLTGENDKEANGGCDKKVGRDGFNKSRKFMNLDDEDEDDKDDWTDEGDEEEKKSKRGVRKPRKEEGDLKRKMDLDAKIEKAVENGLEGLYERIEKSFDKKFGALSKVTTATLEETRELQKGFDSIPLQGRKSATSVRAIEKGFGGGSNDNSQQLSLSRDKQQVMQILTSKAAIEKGEQSNPLYVDAVMSFEATGQISPRVIGDLHTQGIEVVS